MIVSGKLQDKKGYILTLVVVLLLFSMLLLGVIAHISLYLSNVNDEKISNIQIDTTLQNITEFIIDEFDSDSLFVDYVWSEGCKLAESSPFVMSIQSIDGVLDKGKLSFSVYDLNKLEVFIDIEYLGIVSYSYLYFEFIEVLEETELDGELVEFDKSYWVLFDISTQSLL